MGGFVPPTNDTANTPLVDDLAVETRNVNALVGRVQLADDLGLHRHVALLLLAEMGEQSAALAAFSRDQAREDAHAELRVDAQVGQFVTRRVAAGEVSNVGGGFLRG